MGQFHYEDGLSIAWLDLSDYFRIKVNYKKAAHIKQDYWLLKEVWPDVRNWVLDDCDGDVITVPYYHGIVTLYFEKKEDLIAFKLRWL